MTRANIKPFPIQGGRSRTIKRDLKGDPWWAKVLAVLAFVVLAVGLIAFFVGVGAVVVLLAWNVGVKAIVSACGGSVGPITFWEAVGVSFLLNILRRPKITTTA